MYQCRVGTPRARQQRASAREFTRGGFSQGGLSNNSTELYYNDTQ